MSILIKNLVFISFVLLSTSLFAQVGIGTTTPAEQLDVDGNIQFSGELKPNGASGNSGQVLTSQGVGNVNEWKSPTNTLYNNSYQNYGSSELTANSGTYTVLPGLTQSVNLTGNAKVIITADGGMMTSSSANNGYSTVDVVLHQDGVMLSDGGFKRVIALNGRDNDNTIENWSFSVLLSMSAGTYTWDVRSRLLDGSNATVSGDNLSVLQGSLSIVVIYE